MKATMCIAVGLAACVMTSCSNNEVMEVQERNSISYNVLSQNAVSRSTAVTSSNLTTAAPNFKVYGFLAAAPKTQYVGTGGNGVKITYQTNKWDYAQASDLLYWPGGSTALNFYAVNPAENDGTHFPGTGFSEESFTADAQSFKYTVHGSATYQKDLMYAMKLGQSSGQVALSFKHALSQIIFKAKVTSSALTVKVKDVVIKNLKNAGKFTFPALETGTGVWSELGGKTSFSLDIPSEVTLNDPSQTKDLCAGNGPLLLIPQTSTAWTTTVGTPVTTTVADTNGHTYLQIDCEITYNGQNITFTGSNIYVPFKAEWEPGKKYVYTLNFGGGYKLDGTPVLNPITYGASVSPWTPEEPTPADVTF